MDSLPNTALKALKLCDKNTLPSVHLGLRLFASIPATSMEAERSFSSLKRIKTLVRSTMGDTKLNSDTLITTNRDIPIDFSLVLDRLKGTKDRRF